MTATLSGVLIVDKPAGPTSHDVVQRLRRVLGERRIGHAGTLDPAATGVLVVLVGEATKLEPYFSGCDKAYVADVLLGRATDTLDLEGATVAEAEPSDALRDELQALERATSAPAPLVVAALDVERARLEQVPPSFSAIKVAGRRSHAEARAGRPPELPPRAVRVREVELASVQYVGERPVLTVRLDVTKGYYVRSFARDVGASLGLPAMLAGLRRTRSGPFDLSVATAPDLERAALVDRLIPIERAAASLLPMATLTVEGAVRARQGKRLRWGDDVTGTALEPGAHLGLLGPEDAALIAIAVVEPPPPCEPGSDVEAPAIPPIRVVRGFVTPT